MSTIVNIESSDQVSASRTDINTNFSNLNTDKLEINPALGTPASGVLTNCTGTAAGLTVGATTGVEAGADVTDTTNVTAAGALMDSEVTNLAQVKAFDTTDYATAAQGTTADSAQQPPVEGAFVDGDKTKLDGIEASADVTDTANVTSAGALMDSELTSIADVKALDQSVVSGATPTFTTTNFTDASNKRLMTDAQETVLDNTSNTNTGDESAASATVAGVIELATDAETTTGTATDRAITPANLASQGFGTGSGDALVANGLDQFAATTSAELKGVIPDETGSGALVFATSPTLVTPALGTPASGVMTNVTGTAGGLTAGNVTTNANLTGHVTSTGNAAVLGSFTKAQLNTAISDGVALNDVVDDTTPELGGELDCGAHSIGFTMQSATGDGTTTVDWKLGNHFDFTFGAFNETFTFTAPTNPGVYTMSLKQDSGGSRTATWPATVKWPAGTAPTLTTTATTGYDVVSFRFDGTNYYSVATLNFS